MSFTCLIVVMLISFWSLTLVTSIDKKISKISAISGIVFLFSFAWFIGAETRSYKIDQEEILDYYECNLSNGTSVQMISYMDKGKGIKSVNLNEIFKVKLNKNSKVKITNYSYGPYCGLYYNENTFVINTTFEIVNTPIENNK